MLTDVRRSIRGLAHAPGFAIAVVTTLALAIGANTIVFSVVNGLLLRPPPVDEPDRLVQIHTGSSHASYPNYLDFQGLSDVFTDVAAHRYESFNLREGEVSALVSGEYVTGNYFRLLGIGAARGRALGEEDDRAGAPPVAVISESLWKRRWAGSSEIVGQTLFLNGHPVSIVGVAPPEFRGPYPVVLRPDVWVPVSAQPLLLSGPDRFADREERWLQLLGRLRPGVTESQARAAAATMGSNLETAYPTENLGLGKTALYGLTGVDAYRGIGFAPLVLTFLVFLTFVVFLVLFVACANVANMFLARGWSRQRTVAIRSALGAKRGRIFLELLTESLVIACVGGLLGCLLAYFGVGVAEKLQDLFPVPLGIRLSVDRTVLLYTLALSILTGLVFGVAPSWRASRTDMARVLGASGVTASIDRRRFKSVLVAGEVAACCVLLVCSGLFVRSLGRAGEIDPGFESRRILTVSLDLQTSGYDEETGVRLLERLASEVVELPGVRSASFSNILPLSLNRIEFRVASDQESSVAELILANHVGPGYFATMNIPLLAGREFSTQDGPEAPQVVIVSEELAKRFWPGENAVGKILRTGGAQPGTMGPPMEVVGVARDSKYYTLGEQAQAVLYQCSAQNYRSMAVLEIATAAAPGSLAKPVTDALHAIDPTLLLDVAPIEKRLEVALMPARIAAWTTGIVAALGLLLATAGIYALLAYFVEQRRREIGIRMALGANKMAVLQGVIRQGVTLAGAGAGVGLLLSLAIVQLLRGFLIGVAPVDLPTFAWATGVLLAVAAAASWAPARRATAANPVDVLRSE